MPDYILFVVLFGFFLFLVFLTTTPELDLWLPKVTKTINIGKINFAFSTAITVATIPVVISYNDQIDSIPANAGWNRKNSTFFVVVITLLGLNLFHWLQRYFFSNKFFQMFEIDGEGTREKGELEIPFVSSLVWNQSESIRKIGLFAAYVITILTFTLTRINRTVVKDVNNGFYTHVGLVIVAALILLMDLYYTSGAIETSKDKVSEIVEKFSVMGFLKRNVRGFSSRNSKVNANENGKIFKLEGHNKTLNTSNPSHAVLKDVVERPHNFGKDIAFIANTTAGRINGSYYLHNKRDVLKALGPLKNQVKSTKFNHITSTGANETITAFEFDEAGSDGVFMSGYTIAAFTMFHLAWSIILFEDIKVGTTFWVVSNFLPFTIGVNKPNAWWGVYLINQLAVFNFGWIFEQVLGIEPDQKYLFGNFDETNYIPAEANMTIVANANKNAAMATLYNTTDVVVTFAYCLVGMIMIGTIVSNTFYASK